MNTATRFDWIYAELDQLESKYPDFQEREERRLELEHELEDLRR